jgi:methionyl-tRNA formyltransferase
VSTQTLDIIFAGTPEFAAVALKALIDSPHRIVAVYTQPDRQSGRGLKITQSPVKELALANKLPVYQPSSLKNPDEQEQLKKLNADVMVVAAYGLLLPSAVLAIPRLGCVNIHPSLLPRWRGAAPIQRTIFAGDKKSGVTIMQLDEGLDTGPMLLQKEYILAENETSQTLLDHLAQMGASALIETLQLMSENRLQPRQQDNTHATYANKITKEEAMIDWAQPAEELEWEVRAFNPWPVCYTTWKEQHVRIWQAKAIEGESLAKPRTILRVAKDGIDIATGSGALRLLAVQLPGGKMISVTDFYNAHQADLVVGDVFI